MQNVTHQSSGAKTRAMREWLLAPVRLRALAWLMVAAVLFAAPRSAEAANRTWINSGGGNGWNQGGNWTGNTVPTTLDDIYFVNSPSQFSNYWLSPIVDLNVSGSVRSLIITTDTSFTISSANSSLLLLNTGSLTRTTAASGTQTISAGVTLGANATWSIDGSGKMLVSGVIDDGASTFSLTKTGTGLLVLSGANTYSGATTISSGTLQVGDGGTTGSLGAGAITDNAALVFNRTNNWTLSNNVSGTGDVLQIGTGTTTLSGSNSYTGGTTLSAGGLVVGSTNALGSFADLTVTSGTLNLNGFSVRVGTLSGAGGGITSGAAATAEASPATPTRSARARSRTGPTDRAARPSVSAAARSSGISPAEIRRRSSRPDTPSPSPLTGPARATWATWASMIVDSPACCPRRGAGLRRQAAKPVPVVQKRPVFQRPAAEVAAEAWALACGPACDTRLGAINTGPVHA